jgi:hypothetical protein
VCAQDTGAECLVPGCAGGDVPPMGGKRTLRSIKKQSVPHILTVVVDGGRVEFGISGKSYCCARLVKQSVVA